ncbi:hypothetical protein, partial [Mesorhizobium argentiipisi]
PTSSPTPSARYDEPMVANQSIRGVKIGRRFPGLWGQFCTPIHTCTRLLKIEGDPADQSGLLRKRLKAKKGQLARDGFSLLTEFRNGVTHSWPFDYDMDIFHAWDASQWLLEMQLLALFNYRGKYQDRRLEMRSHAGNLATFPVE